ncbi:MAG: hypothetical protein V3V01_15640 [Acidimicrobiales bacterium]
MFNDPKDEDVRRLLQAVEADTTRTSPNRDMIRRSVLATFDDSTVAPAEDESEVITLVSLGDTSRRSIASRRAFGWVAAVAAVFVAAMLVLPDGGGRLDTTTPPASGGLSLDRTDLPALLLPGQQNADGIAGGVSFDAPEGLVVIAASEGQLILALAGQAEGSSGHLMLLEMELSDWEGLLRSLAESSEVNLKEIGVLVNGRATTRLDVSITNEALAARSCVVGEPCISLDWGPSTSGAALWAGSDNRIVEIGRTEDSMVLAIEVSQQFQGPFSRLAAQVVSTSSLSSD